MRGQSTRVRCGEQVAGNLHTAKNKEAESRLRVGGYWLLTLNVYPTYDSDPIPQLEGFPLNSVSRWSSSVQMHKLLEDSSYSHHVEMIRD